MSEPLRQVLHIARDVAYTLLATALLVEVGSRFALRYDAALDRVARLGPDGARIAALERASRADGDPLRATATIPWVHDPLLGWSNRPGSWERTGYVTTVDADRRRTAPPGPAEPARRILTIGDSFTFGDEVGDADAWPNRLATALTDDAIVNLGVLSYGHDQILLRYEEEGRALDADLVILGFASCDITRNVLGFSNWFKPRFRLDGDDLVLVGSPVPEPETWIQAFEWRPRVLDVLTLWRYVRYDQNPARELDAAQRDLTRAILGRLERDVAEDGAELLYVYLPIPAEYDRLPDGGEPRGDNGHAFFTAWCEADPSRRCVDLLPAFLEARRSGADLTRIAHWTEAGHALVADALLPFLTEPALNEE